MVINNLSEEKIELEKKWKTQNEKTLKEAGAKLKEEINELKRQISFY